MKRGFGIILLMTVFAVYSCSMPAPYEIGSVAKMNAASKITAPAQDSAGPNFWDMGGGVKLFQYSSGSGTPVLVIHGGPGIPYVRAWEGLSGLNDRFAFHYYHQRGCGNSTRPIDRFTNQNWYQNFLDLYAALGAGVQIADIERIRQILGVAKLIIIGHSYGGFLATLYALEFPDNVEKLVLVSPAAMLTFPMPEDRNLYAQVKAVLDDAGKKRVDDYTKRLWDYGNIFSKSEAELVALNNEFTPIYVEYLNKIGLGDTMKVAETLENADMTGGWMVHALTLSFGMNYDFRPTLKGIKAPTLVIYGDKDIGKNGSLDYVSNITGVQAIEIADSGHFPFEEKPALFEKAVAEFLK